MNYQQPKQPIIATVSAPGKVILCGQHAVVYGYDALAMAIELRCTASIAVKQQGPSKICFKGSLDFELLLEEIPVDVPEEYSQYAQGLKLTAANEQYYKILYKISIFLHKSHLTLTPQTPTTFTITIHSEIPIGKCLGSSASFNTVLTGSLFVVAGLCRGMKILVDRDKINAISKIMQRIQHGTPSGIDNYVSVFGGLVLYNNSRTPPFTSITDPKILNRLTQGLSLGLVDSGVEKNTKKAVQIVRQYWEKEQKYRDLVARIGSFTGRVLGLLAGQGEQQGKDWQKEIFDIMSENHRMLRELGISIPEIEQIVHENTVEGVKSAKITGAGMGGYVLIAEKPSQAEKPPQAGTLPGQKSKITTKIAPQGLLIEYT